MDAIVAGHAKAGIALVEDAAQAQGARVARRPAGLVRRRRRVQLLSRQEPRRVRRRGRHHHQRRRVSAKIRSFADHGRRAGTRHEHEYSGCNSRLDALQAAILSIKLKRLDDWNAARRAAADLYRTLLDGTNCRVLRATPARPRCTTSRSSGWPNARRRAERARRARDRLGSPLPDSMPSPTPSHALHMGRTSVTEKRRRRDRVRSHVPDDHPSRSRTRMRDTGRGNPREREWNSRLRAPRRQPHVDAGRAGSAGDRRGRDVPVEAPADHAEDRHPLRHAIPRDHDRLLRARVRRGLDGTREVRRSQRDHVPDQRRSPRRAGSCATTARSRPSSSRSRAKRCCNRWPTSTRCRSPISRRRSP